MKNTARELALRYGPRFFRDGNGHDMFEHRIDASAAIGPRPATKTDKQNHPKLWAEFLEGVTANLNASLEETKAKRGPGRPRKEA